MVEKLSLTDVKQAFRPLDVTQLPPEEDGGEIPPEFETAPPPPQPQRFLFRLPADMSNCWEIMECKQADPNNPAATVPLTAYQGDDGKRVALRFDDASPLTIVGQARGGPGGRSYIGETPHMRIDNRERNRARRGEKPILVSNLKYLLSALYEAELQAKSIVLPRNGDNNAVIELLLKKAGQIFSADLEWSASCNPERQAYVLVDGTLTPWVDVSKTPNEPVNGCGARVYQSRWPKPDGWYAERMQCPGNAQGDPNRGIQPRPQCFAMLRPFAELRRFKSAAQSGMTQAG